MSGSENRGGRPKVSPFDKRNIHVGTKLSEVEYALLMKKVEKAKLSVYEYLKRAFNNAQISHHDYKTMEANLNTLKQTTILRMIIAGSTVRTASMEEVDAQNRIADSINRLFQEIRHVGVNLNTIAKQANAGFTRDYYADLKKFADEVFQECQRYYSYKQK